MKRKITKILAAAASLVMAITTLTGCNDNKPTKQQEMGVIDESSQKVELAQGDKDASTLPFYDVGNIPISYNEVSLEYVNTYYRQQLSTRLAIVYNDIRAAALENNSVVNLSKTITEEELFQLMSIMYVDDIEAYNIDSKYSYTKNESGYVEKVYLNYFNKSQEEERTTVEWYNSIMSDIQTKAVGFFAEISEIKTTREDKEILKDTSLSIDYNAAKGLIEIAQATGQMKTDTSIKSNSRNIARAYSYYCRYIGIPCMVKMGILTDETMSSHIGTGSGIKALEDVKNLTTYDEETKMYNVDFSYDDYYFWNVIQIDGKWYNVDIVMNNDLSSKKEESNARNTVVDWMLFAPDYVMSMSRISQYSDIILGESPACTDNQYLSLYRQGKYILKHNQAQMKSKIEDIISLYKGAGINDYSYQFEDEETYNFFIEMFDECMENYNKINNSPIINYNIATYKSALVVEIRDLKFR